MADEKTTPPAAAPVPATPPAGDNKGAPAKAAGVSPMQSPWLPVLVVMIITPILSFVITENLMIPRVKKALGEIALIQQQSSQPANGGPLPTDRKDSKAKTNKDGKVITADDTTVKFDNVVANLSGTLKSRFVKVSFTIEGDDEEFKSKIEPNKAKIIDSALGILGALTVSELDEPGMKNIVRNDLIDAFNQSLEKPIVKRLYFSEFVIQ
jgi:flagellar FliL protein